MQRPPLGSPLLSRIITFDLKLDSFSIFAIIPHAAAELNPNSSVRYLKIVVLLLLLEDAFAESGMTPAIITILNAISINLAKAFFILSPLGLSCLRYSLA